MRRLGKLTAMVVLAAVTAQSAPAQGSSAPLATIGATASARVPSARITDRTVAATLLHPAIATAAVNVSISFKPRNVALLARLASTRDGAAAIPASELRRLFAPASSRIVATTSYLRSEGLRAAGGGFLTRSYTGSVADVEHAFGTTLGTYRSSGVTFRSPMTAPNLPVALASGVVSVTGLDTFPAATPASLPATAPTVSSGCAGSSAAQKKYGGYQPKQFATPSAYNFRSLLNTGGNGSGESLAVVEFSDYSTYRVSAYQTCYGTSVPVTDVTVNGGPTDSTGAALDRRFRRPRSPFSPPVRHQRRVGCPKCRLETNRVHGRLNLAAFVHAPD